MVGVGPAGEVGTARAAGADADDEPATDGDAAPEVSGDPPGLDVVVPLVDRDAGIAIGIGAGAPPSRARRWMPVVPGLTIEPRLPRVGREPPERGADGSAAADGAVAMSPSPAATLTSVVEAPSAREGAALIGSGVEASAGRDAVAGAEDGSTGLPAAALASGDDEGGGVTAPDSRGVVGESAAARERLISSGRSGAAAVSSLESLCALPIGAESGSVGR